jgi:phage shock protein C
MTKRLYKSKEDKIIAGVIGGLGEYFDIDPTILRLLYILIAIVTGLIPAVLGYIIAVLVVPNHPHSHTIHHVPHTEPEKK